MLSSQKLSICYLCCLGCSFHRCHDMLLQLFHWSAQTTLPFPLFALWFSISIVALKHSMYFVYILHSMTDQCSDFFFKSYLLLDSQQLPLPLPSILFMSLSYFVIVPDCSPFFHPPPRFSSISQYNSQKNGFKLHHNIFLVSNYPVSSTSLSVKFTVSAIPHLLFSHHGL